MNALVYVDIIEKNKVARNEKRKKLVHGFEVFWRDKNSSRNLLFLGSAGTASLYRTFLYFDT